MYWYVITWTICLLILMLKVMSCRCIMALSRDPIPGSIFATICLFIAFAEQSFSTCRQNLT